ncbi:MAG: hypothetical protein EXS14_09745 [Planctomycetes bacterium]|nr:hypothetical protein [Planctomycetota bacterium]
MNKTASVSLCALLLLLCVATTFAQQVGIPLLQKVRLSPNGNEIAFAWRDDVWKAPAAGGAAQRLTAHDAADTQPCFSPDGTRIAFISQRADGAQVFAMSAAGGVPTQITRHTEGHSLQEWLPDGQGFLVSAARDHFWRGAQRFWLQPSEFGPAPKLVFDDYGTDGRLSPDGTKLLFVRESEPVYRKHYHGSQASQIWLYDITKQSFEQLHAQAHGARWPLWAPDGEHYYWCSQADGAWNLMRSRIGGRNHEKLTQYKDDGVLFPDISRDGSTIIFSQQFTLQRMDVASGNTQEVVITAPGDLGIEGQRRVQSSSATDVAFTDDAREIALVAGGDLYVMDTELKEPVRVLQTAAPEREPLFSQDHQTLWFLSEPDGQVDIYAATKTDATKPFWLNAKFEVTRITNDAAVESELRLDPTGKSLCFVRGRGELVLRNVANGEEKKLLDSWNAPDFDFSPDGKWIAYALEDEEFNSDIWVAALDGSQAPFNLSCHPDNDRSPRWSPDGKTLAFVGRRFGEESDIMYVHLARDSEEESSRDRQMEKALKKMEGRKNADKPKENPTTTGAAAEPATGKAEPATVPEPAAAATSATPAPTKDKPNAAASKGSDKTPKPTVVEFEGLRERIHRISLPDSTESRLSWTVEGRKLCFSGTVNGKAGSWMVEFPEAGTPKELTSPLLTRGRWIKEGDQMVGLSSGAEGLGRMGRGGGGGSGGTPATLTASGKLTTYAFKVESTVNIAERNAALFDQAWRVMRDRWYDEKFGNSDWSVVRERYRACALRCQSADELSVLVNMMLGELNGSHLGFTFGESADEPTLAWTLSTGHLGTRFDPAWTGPGLKVRDVVSLSPAARKESLIGAGEIVLSIDSVELDPARDNSAAFTGRSDRDVQVRVKAVDGTERTVTLRPTSFGSVRARLYEDWISACRASVDKLSGGKVGYLHIEGMGAGNLLRFEEDLYRAGHGKDGLIIDVRENGGGSITDHLLTCLTQPHHAITVPRGGTQGYPQDRRIYAAWNKPIAVLCNQNSFSNAEIFSHSIKTLGRGKVVGVPTAGGVISTGGTALMDGAFIRLPSRGWFTLDGEDMELHGCEPDEIVWPKPGEMPAGKDRQLERAVEELLSDVKAWNKRPQPQLRKATDR